MTTILLGDLELFAEDHLAATLSEDTFLPNTTHLQQKIMNRHKNKYGIKETSSKISQKLT
jgi:hypothetical protein